MHGPPLNRWKNDSNFRFICRLHVIQVMLFINEWKYNYVGYIKARVYSLLAAETDSRTRSRLRVYIQYFNASCDPTSIDFMYVLTKCYWSRDAL